MEYSDDNKNQNGSDSLYSESITISVNDGADSETMPKVVRPVKAPKPAEPEEQKPSFAGEIAAVTVKTVAVVLSLVVLITCLLAVCLPLPTMRIFDKFGFDARAVDFAERYISRELEDYGADRTDARGNYTKLSVTRELTNSDFTEALYVCIHRSYKLMNKAYAAGDYEEGKYYAARVEKYTRMFLSLNNVNSYVRSVDENNIANVPVILRPAVYSYLYDMRTMNYRARSFLGSTGLVAYENMSNNLGVLEELDSRARKFATTLPSDPNDRNAKMALLDEYCDFIGQLGEYIDVELILAGVENDLTKRVDITFNDAFYPNTSVFSEMAMGRLYKNKLKGNEFSLFVVGLKDITEARYGFTYLYTSLKNSFSRYVEWAVEFVPTGTEAITEELHRLHWLRVLDSTAQRLWYMEMLLNNNVAMFGPTGQVIAEEKGELEQLHLVNYNDRTIDISGIYEIKLTEYLSHFKSSQGE